MLFGERATQPGLGGLYTVTAHSWSLTSADIISTVILGMGGGYRATAEAGPGLGWFNHTPNISL